MITFETNCCDVAECSMSKLRVISSIAGSTRIMSMEPYNTNSVFAKHSIQVVKEKASLLPKDLTR